MVEYTLTLTLFGYASTDETTKEKDFACITTGCIDHLGYLQIWLLFDLQAPFFFFF